LRSSSFSTTNSLRLAFHHLLAEARVHLVEQGFVAPQVACFEDRGADGVVARRFGDRLGDRAAGVADLEAKIPEQ
jgi:hypothetical protein